MRFSLQREVLLKPLAQVVNVVERRQTLPVLANLLVKVRDGQLALTGTDLEVEMVAPAVVTRRTARHNLRASCSKCPRLPDAEDTATRTATRSPSKRDVAVSLSALPPTILPLLTSRATERWRYRSRPEVAYHRTAFAWPRTSATPSTACCSTLRQRALCVATRRHAWPCAKPPLRWSGGSSILARVMAGDCRAAGGGTASRLELGRNHILVKRDAVPSHKLIAAIFGSRR